jgi:hypothetical protein
VKFSGRQVLASAAGAVIAAVIASIFGVKGTIVGVAIGSAVATLGTAFVAQSIERGQEAVKQVVVRAPDTSPLLRRLGGTGPSGAASSVDTSSAPAETTSRFTAGESIDAQGSDAELSTEQVSIESSPAFEAETEPLGLSATAGVPATERLEAVTLPPPAPQRSLTRLRWSTLVGTAAVVFVLALGFVTAIELISGKPLSDIFGGAGGGTTVDQIINPPPASTTTTTTTSTTTTTGPSSTTTSSTGSTTTSTAAPGGSGSTTTTIAGSTTTTGASESTTSTTGTGGGP